MGHSMAHIEPRRHRAHHRGIAAVGQVPEVVAAELLLRPQPRQRLVLGGAGGIRFDSCVQCLPGSSEDVSRESGRGQIRLDPLGGRGGRSKPGTQPGEGLAVAVLHVGQTFLDLRRR